MFGQPCRFAVEVGDIDREFSPTEPFLAFRFWLGGVPLGDWEDRISLKASIAWARLFVSHSSERETSRFPEMSAYDMYLHVYRRFFDSDYATEPQVSRNLRDLCHLDSIGMGAIEDKVGVIAVATKDNMERVIAVDLRSDHVLSDVRLPLGECDVVLRSYIEWGDAVLA
jgi:hypothetical protein